MGALTRLHPDKAWVFGSHQALLAQVNAYRVPSAASRALIGLGREGLVCGLLTPLEMHLWSLREGGDAVAAYSVTPHPSRIKQPQQKERVTIKWDLQGELTSLAESKTRGTSQ